MERCIYLKNTGKKQLTGNGLLIYVSLIIWIYSGNTLNEHEFDQIVSEAIKEREKHFLQVNRMEIETDSRIVKALEEWDFISSRFYTQ